LPNCNSYALILHKISYKILCSSTSKNGEKVKPLYLWQNSFEKDQVATLPLQAAWRFSIVRWDKSKKQIKKSNRF
jgi:hypothetical protein